MAVQIITDNENIRIIHVLLHKSFIDSFAFEHYCKNAGYRKDVCGFYSKKGKTVNL